MKRHLNMESDTDSTTSSGSRSRLGKCEVCNYEDAKYTCPKCEVKTCCLNCLKIHKKELNCDGIRDPFKYIPINKMTKLDFMNDYRFLEECTRYVENRKTDQIKRYTRYNKILPSKLFKLRNAANERNIILRFLLDNFTKHKINTTYYDWKTKIIYWHIEWIFTNANNIKYEDNKCSENDTLIKLLDKYLNIENKDDLSIKKSLEYYQSKGIGNIKILLKSEGIKRCRKRYYLLDCRKTLKENLKGKTIVEYPTIYLCYDDALDEFDIIDSDEDVETEAKQYRKTLDEICRKQLEEQEAENMKVIEEQLKKQENSIQDELEKLIIAKKREKRRQKREEMKNKNESKNYLFSNEHLLDVISSSDDTDNDGNETEEENTVIASTSKYTR